MKYGWLQDRIQFRKEDFNNVRTFQICEYQAQKRKNDAAKGKIFTMIGREIAVAVKEGGPDPANNFKLAQVIAKAKANNMPNDTIERGIKKRQAMETVLITRQQRMRDMDQAAQQLL